MQGGACPADGVGVKSNGFGGVNPTLRIFLVRRQRQQKRPVAKPAFFILHSASVD